jgi:hypothetical protein
LGVTPRRDVRVEIDSIEMKASDLVDLAAVEKSIAARLEGTIEEAGQVAAEIARSIGAEVAR